VTYSETELQEQLSRTYSLSGSAKFAALDAVFRHADAAGLVEFAFNARMNAISEFHHGGDPTRAFLAFSWCLGTFDRQPEVVAGYHAHSLLWRFKWIVWALPQFPEIPLDRTEAVLADMERRYQLGGHSLHAVYQHRWLVAHHVGDHEAAEAWYDRMLTARRDGLSDCQACVPSSQVRHLASLGRYDEAITVGQPFSRGGCTEQPHWMLSELLLPYLLTGRLDEAVDAHRRAYRIMRNDRHHLDNIAQHVLFCGLTGNEARGLELIERHIGWLERPSSPFAAMEFASAAALVLGRLRENGHGELTVQRRSDDGTRRWEQTVDEAHAELVVQARDLAARFDRRNGNDHQSSRIEQRMAATPVVDRLPLTALTGRTNGSADPLAAQIAEATDLVAAGNHHAAATARLRVARALHDAKRWDDALEAAEEALRALERTAQKDDAARCRYLLWRLYRRDHRYRAEALTIADELIALTESPSGLPPAAVLLEESAEFVHGADAVARLIAAADRHAVAGASSDELRALRKALGAGARLSPLPEALPRALSRADVLLSAHPDVSSECAGLVHGFAVTVLRATGQPGRALERADQAIPLLRTAGRIVDACRVGLDRARLLLDLDRPAEAELQALDVLTDPAWRSDWAAATVLAQALLRQERKDEAERVVAEYHLDEDDLYGELDDD
jgi:tetratricopeptide (TPR) repeat protein